MADSSEIPVQKKDKKRRGRWGMLLLAVVALACAWTGALGFGPFVFASILAVFLVRRQFVIGLTLLALSPLVLCFAQGAVDYFRGQACLRYMGLPGTEFHNADPGSRLQRSTGGCLVNGGEWSLHLPYNAGAKAMVLLFGPMPGSYTGPYPDKDQTIKALTTAKEISPDDLIKDRVMMDKREIKLDTGVGKRLLERISNSFLFPELREEMPPITATLWQDQCLILRIPTRPRDTKEDSAAIVLIDCRSGRPFAYYKQGDYYHHFPPVWWIEH